MAKNRLSSGKNSSDKKTGISEKSGYKFGTVYKPGPRAGTKSAPATKPAAEAEAEKGAAGEKTGYKRGFRPGTRTGSRAGRKRRLKPVPSEHALGPVPG